MVMVGEPVMTVKKAPTVKIFRPGLAAIAPRLSPQLLPGFLPGLLLFKVVLESCDEDASLI